ncbi:unnamed protein product [Closterium sp. NIES-54]
MQLASSSGAAAVAPFLLASVVQQQSFPQPQVQQSFGSSRSAAVAPQQSLRSSRSAAVAQQQCSSCFLGLRLRNRTHRERRRTSSCLAERIAPVRRDPQRMLRDGRRPRGNFRRRRRPATTRRRVVFRSNGDDRRLPRRQHEPRLKGHLRRGRRAEHRAARRHDPHMTRAHAVHSSAPFIPHSIQSLSPPVVSPPTELVFPPLSLPHPACQSGSSPKPCPCSFNVYVSQAEVKPGCVLRQSTATYWCPKIRRREKNQRLRAVMIVRLVMIYEAC